MKSMSEKQKFIELRAKGLSFDKIAQELGICKPTLLKWSQDYKKEIANLLYFQLESIIIQFRLEKSARVEAMAGILSKALDELKSRSFQELSAKDLLAMIDQTGEKLRGELSCVCYTTDETVDPRTEWQEEILTPRTLPFPY